MSDDAPAAGAHSGDDTRRRACAVIQQALAAGGLEYESPQPGAFLVKLPGQHKLATMCWLVVGDHSVLVEAFVMRRPDEDHRRVHDLMLTRNSGMYGVAWAIDKAGDVFLVGRVAHHSITADEVDRLLGCVLEYADTTFDTLLEIGFGSSIRREWEWRHKRGESLANLTAFARFADPARAAHAGASEESAAASDSPESTAAAG